MPAKSHSTLAVLLAPGRLSRVLISCLQRRPACLFGSYLPDTDALDRDSTPAAVIRLPDRSEPRLPRVPARTPMSASVQPRSRALRATMHAAAPTYARPFTPYVQLSSNAADMGQELSDLLLIAPCGTSNATVIQPACISLLQVLTPRANVVFPSLCFPSSGLCIVHTQTDPLL